MRFSAADYLVGFIQFLLHAGLGQGIGESRDAAPCIAM
jgi:hypothetical protein